MKSIEEIQQNIIEEFNRCGDGFDQYEHLIKNAANLRPFTAEDRKLARIVQGCQSSVWITISCADGVFDFSGYSHSAIINGLIALLQELFCGQALEDVAKAEITFLHDTSILDNFESERAKGVQYMIRMLQEEAAAGINKNTP